MLRLTFLYENVYINFLPVIPNKSSMSYINSSFINNLSLFIVNPCFVLGPLLTVRRVHIHILRKMPLNWHLYQNQYV